MSDYKRPPTSLFIQLAHIAPTDENISQLVEAFGGLDGTGELKQPIANLFPEIFDEWGMLIEKVTKLFEFYYETRRRPQDFNVNAVMLQLTTEINRELKASGVYTDLTWDCEHQRVDVGVFSPTLRGIIWSDFARAVVENINYQQCAYCAGWMEVGGSRSARADKKFCNPSHKAQAHRLKKEAGIRD